MKRSTFLAINWQDALKGLIVAVLSTVLSSLYSILDGGNMPSAAEWRTIGMVAITSAVAYLLKNFLTNQQGEPLKSDKQ